MAQARNDGGSDQGINSEDGRKGLDFRSTLWGLSSPLLTFECPQV